MHPSHEAEMKQLLPHLSWYPAKPNVFQSTLELSQSRDPICILQALCVVEVIGRDEAGETA